MFFFQKLLPRRLFFRSAGVSLGTRLELESTWFVRPPAAETFLGLTKKRSINFKQLLPFTNQEDSFLFIDYLKIHLPTHCFIRIFEWAGMMKQNWGFLLLVPPFTKTCMSGSFVSPFGSPFSVMALFHGLLSDGPDRGGGEWSAWRWDIPGPRWTKGIVIVYSKGPDFNFSFKFNCFKCFKVFVYLLFWESNGLKDCMFYQPLFGPPGGPIGIFRAPKVGDDLWHASNVETWPAHPLWEIFIFFCLV